MSKYTLELRELANTFGEAEVKSWFMQYDMEDYLTQEEVEVIMDRGTWSADRLAQKILDHYYLREIAFETPSLFVHKVKVAMQEIMEEKLPLIYSASIKYDPLVNVDYTETYNASNESKGKSTGTGLNVDSDTPQGQINKNEILNGTYASATSANNAESESETTGKDNYIKHIKGNSGVTASAQKMVEQYRDNIITIDRDIIDELNDLFLGLL